MLTIDNLISRDSVTAAWFWITSESVGPYTENEKFDAVFVRDTSHVVGGGYRERRTFYVRGITTAQVDSRREHGGKIIRPDATAVLAHVIADAYEAVQYGSFREWAEDTRDFSRDYRDAFADLDDWNTHRVRHQQLTAWLGDEYDEYVKAAQQYVSEH